MFFLRADSTRYGPLHREVYNDRLKGTDDYPQTVTEAYNRIVKWLPDPKVQKHTAPDLEVRMME